MWNRSPRLSFIKQSHAGAVNLETLCAVNINSTSTAQKYKFSGCNSELS